MYIVDCPLSHERTILSKLHDKELEQSPRPLPRGWDFWRLRLPMVMGKGQFRPRTAAWADTSLFLFTTASSHPLEVLGFDSTHYRRHAPSTSLSVPS